MEWFLKVVRDHYADFDGRARRKELWMFYLFSFLLVIPIAILAGVLVNVSEALGAVAMLAYAAVGLGLVLPSLAVQVRRLHDTGKSGWLLLLSLVPFGGLVLLYFYVIEGDAGPNEYGPDPKADFDDEFAITGELREFEDVL